MRYNWATMLAMVFKNATGKDLDGRDGDFESALYQLIHESYGQLLLPADTAVVCCLICIHKALKNGDCLKETANALIDINRKYFPKPLATDARTEEA